LLPDAAKRWVFVKGTCVLDSEGRPIRTQGVVVDRTDIKRADLDAVRQREAIAHIQRVSTMGELAASLAHELNQPLTAILSNVQAAQRFLAADPTEVEEVREILRDVVEDNNRASEVIRRLRALVRKDPLNFVPLDMGNVVREVVQLTHSDAVLQNVGVSIEYAADLPRVWGDKIQLPQVVLNLIMNAFDAVKNNHAGERRVLVRIEPEDAYNVKVAVRDSGAGLDENHLDEIFEPFFTTKAKGMGMGLTISRSIVEAHGGRLWAENNGDRGATFYFTVRLDRRRSARVKSESERKRDTGDHLGEQSTGHRISDR
jgi:two-component system sensor kinase FixL